MPNAFAALLGVVLLALVFPGYDPALLAKEIAFSALEIVNFHFAEKAVDYFQSDGPASPVLHFWSLAVEEQFYAVWPVLLLLVLRFFRQSVMRSAALLLAVIWCASFAASVALTASEQPLAYFGTGTRCWQLATGALIAVHWRNLQAMAARLRAMMAWGGAAAILAGMALIQDGQSYPGFWALLPTMGAAGLLAGFGAASPQSALRRALATPVMQWFGARSYSWYLWHWPMLALPRMAFPESHWAPVIAVPASLAVASLAYRWIETPFRHGTVSAMAPARILAGAAAGLVVVVASGHLYGALLPVVDQPLAARLSALAAAADDISRDQRRCLIRHESSQPGTCVFGDRAGHRQVVLFGDSHAAHWFDAVNIAARRIGWQLVVHTKASCPSADVRTLRQGKPYDTCQDWRGAVMAMLTGGQRPEAVILSNRTLNAQNIYDPATGDRLDPDEADRTWRDGSIALINRLLDAGIEVMILRAAPMPAKDYRRCIVGGGTCTSPRDIALAGTTVDDDVARELGARVTFVDLTDQFCGAQACSARRDNLIVYRDEQHLTDRFAASLAPIMARHMQTMAERVVARRGEKIAAGDVPATSSLGLDPLRPQPDDKPFAE